MKISYFIVKRDRRENFDNVIDREIISIQNIDFLDVVIVVTNKIIDKIDNFNKTTKDEINNINIAIDI